MLVKINLDESTSQTRGAMLGLPAELGSVQGRPTELGTGKCLRTDHSLFFLLLICCWARALFQVYFQLQLQHSQTQSQEIQRSPFRMFMVSTVKSSMGITMYHYGPASRSVLLLSVWKAYHSLVPLIPHGRAIPQYQSNVWTHLLIQWDFWLVLYFYIYLCFLVNKDVFF